ncbi:MAG: hypothetical protein WBC33_01705 [Conexibacter sp.]
MSGLFQRIARRPAEPTDGTPAQPTDDAPTQQLPAMPEPSATEVAPAAAPEPGAATPTSVQQAVPPAPTSAGETPAPDAAPDVPPVAVAASTVEQPTRRVGFRERGRMRRRLRYLRKLRELQVRDLGGLVFDLRRFERKRDDLVAQKLDHIRACDDELRALESALEERRDVRDVREPGVGGTCPRCFAIHGSNDRFCASCGAALAGAVQGPAQVAPSPAAPAVAPPPVSVPPPAPVEPPASAPPADPNGTSQ